MTSPSPNSYSSPSSTRNEDEGQLVVTVLSAYDLPNDTIPKCVTLQALRYTASTGPPAARHKDNPNSYRFSAIVPTSASSNNNNNSSSTTTTNNAAQKKNELVIMAPLRDLYSETITFRVTYDAPSSSTQPERNGSSMMSLVGRVKLSDTVHVNESRWVILHLQDEKKAVDMAGATPAAASSSPESTTTEPALTSSSAEGGETGGPTLRVKLHLTGPYRTEISALLALTSSWFRIVDSVSGSLDKIWTILPERIPSLKILLVPAVPLAAGAVVLLPVLLGVLIVGLPLFLPFLVVLLTFVVISSLLLSTLYFSTQQGRTRIGTLVTPAYHTFVTTQAGQQIIYDVGQRPTPVSVARAILPNDMIGKLIVSLLIDFIGSASYLLPGVGEAIDVVWAPTQTILIMAMYDNTSPNLKYISFVEEILPFTDVIPTASMGWIKEYGPGFVEGGRKSVLDMTVAVRAEGEALRRSSNRRNGGGVVGGGR